MAEDRSAQVAAVAALAEPTRRRLYEYVVRRPHPVSRDDVAGALGVPRPTAAFHLDRLVADGLLDVHYERRTGRTGPGAGRPAKLYRRSDASGTGSLPERRYDLAGELLASALDEAERSGRPPRAGLERRARLRGRGVGGGGRGAAGGGRGAGGRGAAGSWERRRGPPPSTAGTRWSVRWRSRGSSPAPWMRVSRWSTARSTRWRAGTPNWSAA